MLIPVYNAEKTLNAAVGTIQKQTIRNIRIILIDDGSSDASADIMKQIASMDPRVKVLTKHNGGIVDALNLGLRICDADFIARHDADDLASSFRFERQLRFLEANPDCIAVSSFARHIDDDGLPTGSIARFHPVEWADRKRVPSREPYLLHPFLMMRREALEKAGGYRYVHHSEDTDLYWRLQQLGRLHVMEEVLGDYRYSGHSVSSRSALNGRISAINSQLAAISAGRRIEGKVDLSFEKQAIQEMEVAGSAEGIYQIARRNLEDEEASYLRAAFSAKLLELTAYRPYEVDLPDARFIGPTLLAAERTVSASNLKELRKSRSVTSARLLRKGKIKSALALASAAIIPQIAWRLCAQLLARSLPMGVRRSIRKTRARWVKLDE